MLYYYCGRLYGQHVHASLTPTQNWPVGHSEHSAVDGLDTVPMKPSEHRQSRKDELLAWLMVPWGHAICWTPSQK